MAFQLQSKPLVGPLAEAFPDKKTFRELSYRELRAVMNSAPEGWQAEAVGAASLGVTVEELLDLPGRYAGGVSTFLQEVTAMHGLGGETDSPPSGKIPVGEATEIDSSGPKH